MTSTTGLGGVGFMLLGASLAGTLDDGRLGLGGGEGNWIPRLRRGVQSTSDCSGAFGFSMLVHSRKGPLVF